MQQKSCSFRGASRGRDSFLFHSDILSRLNNNLDRTFFCALAAVGTLLVVNDSQIVLHMDGIKLTLLCTQGTSDTAGRTDSFYIFAFVVGAALYQML